MYGKESNTAMLEQFGSDRAIYWVERAKNLGKYPAGADAGGVSRHANLSNKEISNLEFLLKSQYIQYHPEMVDDWNRGKPYFSIYYIGINAKRRLVSIYQTMAKKYGIH